MSYSRYGACIALLFAALLNSAPAQNTANPATDRFSIRVIDEAVAKDTAQGPAGDDRFPSRTPNPETQGMLWLKRAGAINGTVLAGTEVAKNADGKPVIRFQLTDDGKQQFAVLTQANIGRKIAVVVDGTVLVAPTVMAPMTGGRGTISGNFDEAEANRLAVAMMGKTTPASR